MGWGTLRRWARGGSIGGAQVREVRRCSCSTEPLRAGVAQHAHRILVQPVLIGLFVLDRFERAGEKGENVLSNEERQAALHALNHAAYKLEPPLHELEHALHPW